MQLPIICLFRGPLRFWLLVCGLSWQALGTGSSVAANSALTPNATAPAATTQVAPSREALREATHTTQIFEGETQDPYTLALRAYVWGMPIVNWSKVRLYQTRPLDPWSERPPHASGAPINRMGAARELYGPESQDGVGPNNDTLYSIGNFDTDAGPFVIETPNFGERYYTFTVYMGDTDSIQSPGQRTHGSQLPPLFLYGPSYQGLVPEGTLPIKADTRYVIIAGRILVDGTPSDLSKVHGLQEQIKTRTLDAYLAGVEEEPPVSSQRLLDDERYQDDPPLLFLAQLGNALQDWFVRSEDEVLIASFEHIGLSVAKGFDASTLDREALAAIRQGISDAQDVVFAASKRLGMQTNGWSTNYAGTAFDGDHLLRAAVAKDQIGISVPEEAVYPIGRMDSGGELLEGSRRYRIVFSGDDMPPVNAFWSVTLYDDRGVMVANPINRYSIGDRTPELQRTPDGDIVIALQSTPPAESDANWLPTPENGRFYLMMRLYQPQEAVLTQQWIPPAIERLWDGE